jgi:hypothetical protein
MPIVGEGQCQGSHGYVHLFDALSVAELSDQVRTCGADPRAVVHYSPFFQQAAL